MNKYIAVKLLISLCLLCSILCGCGSSGAGWNQTEEGMVYILDGKPVTGWQEIDGETYWFPENGVMVTGHQEINGQHYYFHDDGTMATGWVVLDKARYYHRANGTRVTGWLDLDGQRYYLLPDGTAAVGPLEVDGALYIFTETGALADGIVELDDQYYCAESGRPYNGWYETDDRRNYFDETGAMVTGWLETETGTYYLQEDGSPYQGQLTMDGVTHYFTSTGMEIVLVNPWHAVPEDYTVELVSIGNSHQIAAHAVADYEEMMADCKAAGLNPVVCSSYRTQEYQEYLYQNRISRYMADGCSKAEATELAGRSVALPGTSEHQLGLALDIIDNSNWRLDQSQADTPTQQWMMEHSWEYGWILRYPDGTSDLTGIIYEPWHYRYVGRELAAELHELDLCLEAYLDMLTPAVG